MLSFLRISLKKISYLIASLKPQFQIAMTLSSLQVGGRGCSLKINSYTVLPHLFHFAVIRTSDCLLTNSIYKTPSNKHYFNHTNTPKTRPKDASGIKFTTPCSTRWAWQEGGYALFLSAARTSRGILCHWYIFRENYKNYVSYFNF